MKRASRYAMAGLIIGCCVGLMGSADAGPYVDAMQPCDCPPTHYSAFHVLTPTAWRWAAWCQGPCRYTFAKNLYPDVQPKYHLVRYHCPSVNPRQFSIENYPGLDGNIRGSTYALSQPAQRPPQQNPPQELPAPREEKGKLPPPEQLLPPTPEPEKPN